MSKDKKKQVGVLGLVIALVVVLIGGVLFVGAVSGWFDDPKVTLDAEYYGEGAEFMELTASEYEGLVEAKSPRASSAPWAKQGGAVWEMCR